MAEECVNENAMNRIESKVKCVHRAERGSKRMTSGEGKLCSPHANVCVRACILCRSWNKLTYNFVFAVGLYPSQQAECLFFYFYFFPFNS